MQEEDELPLMNIRLVKPIPCKAGLTMDVAIDGQPLVMELDTGASVSIVSEVTWMKVLKGCSLRPSPIRLKTYTGQSIQVLGQRAVRVEYGGHRHKLPLVVVAGDGPSLFGRNWPTRTQSHSQAAFMTHS